MSQTDYEKPSRRGQWQERSERPVATRPMTNDDIEEHRRNLVASYQCSDSDIHFEFQKILDENDEDRDDCLLLRYKMKCVVAKKPTVREIFTMKIPIPEELRRMAEQMRQQQAKKGPSINRQTVPATASQQTQQTHQTQQPTYQNSVPFVQPVQQTGPVIEEVTSETTETRVRPKLQKPVRVVKK